MDISRITDDIYVGAQPHATDAEALHALDIGLVISLRGLRRPPAEFTQAPLSSLWLRTYDTFVTPIGMSVFEQGVRAALPVIAQGRKVLVHCHYGRHRSVAMAAAILIAQGATAAEAMQQLRAQRAVADPHIWYIRRQIERFERHWRGQSPPPEKPMTEPAPEPAAAPALSASAQRVQAALAAAGFTLAVVELPQSTRTSAEAAAAVGCAVGQIAKSIIFRAAASDRPVLVLASGPNRVDEAAVSAHLGEPLAKADAAFVRARTGFVIGGVPPISHAEPLPTFIDEDLLAYDEIWAAAGTPNAVFKLTPQQLVSLTGGTLARIKS
jgi:prolyl-tRNA editing enzyme YbaK/EbsC (Cys-tRNA(Pro) deacylase)/protein-tyrosine phosphatase